jgi:pimeloyl-ACP methyl ester carboxylesterase
MPELVVKPRHTAHGPRGRVHTIHYELSYLQQGTVNAAAPVVVLLHGFPGDATQWQSVMPAITTYPVLAFDLLGNGESDKPWPADVSVWGHADALNLALRDMGLQQIILVGYGMGGGVAQVLATRLMPELVRGLVLIDSIAYTYSFNPNWPLTEMEKRQDPELPLHTTIDQLANDLAQTLPQGSAHPRSITDDVLARYITPWRSELGKELLFQQIRKLVPSYLNAVGSDIPYITCPTLLIWGKQDTIVPPAWGERLHRAIQGSDLQLIPDACHLILDDAPDRVAQLLADFVAKR